MTNHCATVTPKLAALKERFVALKTIYDTATRSGDFTQFGQQRQPYLETQEQLRAELKESIKKVVESFVAKRENNNSIVVVDIGEDLTAVVTGDLDFSNRAELAFPNLHCISQVTGYLNLHNLVSADSLTLPKTVGGYLDLSHLTSVINIQLPESVDGFVDLASLASATGLILPQIIGNGLYLDSEAMTDVDQLDLSSVRLIKRDVSVSSHVQGIYELFEDLQRRGILQGTISTR